MKGNYNRRKLKEEHKHWIEGFFEQHKFSRITIGKLQSQLISQFPNLNGISKTSISNWLRKDLKMSYKKLEKKAIVTQRADHIRRVFENAWLQTKIDEEGIETIYIDEFKVSTKHNDFWGWTKRGQRGYISFDPNSFHMSFICAVSKFKVYGVWGSEVTLRSDGVKYFIEQIIASRSRDKEMEDVPFVLWFDNASVHTSSQTRKFLERSGIRAFTVPTYSPWLNPWEKYIGVIKSKLSLIQAEGR